MGRFRFPGAGRYDSGFDERLPTDFAGLRLWTRADLGVSYAMSPVVASGTTPPTLTVTGTPAYPMRFVADIVAGGTLGVATARYSIDGGTTWGGTGTIVAGPTAVGTTGLSVTYAAGTYNADNLYKTSTYVTTWADQSGNGNNFAASSWPVYTLAAPYLNGAAGIHISNGAAPDLAGGLVGPASSAVVSTTDYTALVSLSIDAIAVDNADPANNECTLSNDGFGVGDLGISLRQTGTLARAFNVDSLATVTSVSKSIALNTPHVFSVRHGGNVLGFSLNADVEGTVAALARAASASPIGLGGSFYYPQFYVHEVAIYNLRLSDADVLAVSRYMMGRIGAT